MEVEDIPKTASRTHEDHHKFLECATNLSIINEWEKRKLF